jgi:hypothetical protein
MTFQRLIPLCFIPILAGCGYTVLKQQVPHNRESDLPIATQGIDQATDQVLDSLLIGEWRGRAKCRDHGGRDSKFCRIVFRADHSCTLEERESVFHGTWSSSFLQGVHHLALRVPDSPWLWNGPCVAQISEDRLVLIIDRPYQLSCRVGLDRVTNQSNSVK